MSIDLYKSLAMLVCFDNDVDTDDIPDDDVVVKKPDGQGGGKTDDDDDDDDPSRPKLFTQKDVNRFLAEEKRKFRGQLENTEKEYKALLNSTKLSEEERTKLEESLENVQKQLRTKEEQAKLEKKNLKEQYEGELQEWKQRAEAAESRYIDSTISRALTDAAAQGDAFNPNQVVTLLRPMTKMVEEKPMIDFPDVSTETGESIIAQMTPDEAIKRMKQLPETYGNLFKSGVTGGVGAASATGGLTPGSNGRVDASKLSVDQYMELRQKNPSAVGLRPKK